MVSFFLTVSILFSTSSFKVDMHFCCNKLVGTAILGKAQVCKDKIQKNIPSAKKCTLQEKDCCNSITFLKLGDKTLTNSNPEAETQTLLFLSTFLYSYIDLFEGLDKNVVPFQHYKPPLLSKDMQVLHQTFLI
uniref:HYC_CC_PP family protein n=1 Tax=Mariniflexile sp. TaxID=1979402 RepID=UPI004048E922